MRLLPVRLWRVGPWHAFGPWREEDDYGGWKSREKRVLPLDLY